ncbi:MAG: transporter substrate-binding domain-containing protein [Alteromonadaceae bacterium]|nr:transporter substrate-binding domain-containing protein [Alteromonadaceae bacterium]
MKYLLPILLLLFVAPSFADLNSENKVVKKVKIQILAEDLYPLHYIKKGKVVGSSVDLIKKIMTEAKLDYEIKIQPWARIYQIAQHKKNILLLSISRIEEREALFAWIGRTMKIKYSLYSISDTKIDADIPLKNLDEYRIAIIRESAIDQFLAAKGLHNFQLISTYPQSIKMLLAHRVDLVSGVSQFFIKNCVRLQLNCQPIKAVYQFKKPSSSIFIAMSKVTDNNIIKRIQIAYNKVTQNKPNILNNLIP